MGYCLTEEATKNAMVLPFIHALGYDIFNPAEVVPEFAADIGTKDDSGFRKERITSTSGILERF